MLWKLGVILVLVCSQLMKKSLHIHYLCSLPKQLGGTAMSKCASKLWLYRHMVTSIQTSCFRLCACGWNPKKGNIALGLWQSWYIAHCKCHSNYTAPCNFEPIYIPQSKNPLLATPWSNYTLPGTLWHHLQSQDCDYMLCVYWSTAVIVPGP